MTKIVERRVKSFSAILTQIETFQNSRKVSWYRGTGNSSYELLPTLVRRNPVPSPDDLNRIEKGISNSFAQRSPPFINMDFSSEWKKLFYMQHYGIPTRLLDWTESPFVGLYFALSSVTREKDTGKPKNDVALWLCDPVAWNQTALSHISFPGGILDENCEEIKAYSPSSDIDQRATIPVMIYGTHNSPRIVAQRGVFALFGKGIDSMNKIYQESHFSAGALQKIVIEKNDIDEVLLSLYRKGFSESTIYPDLFGLSLEIRRNFGYQ